MPTFNQLVRKGREKVTSLSRFSRTAEEYEHPEEQGGQPELPEKERRLHRSPYLYSPEEAQLRSA